MNVDVTNLNNLLKKEGKSLYSKKEAITEFNCLVAYVNKLEAVVDKPVEKYSIGDFVYLVTDNEQLERVITSILTNKGGKQYCLAQGTFDSFHSDFEFTTEKDEVKPLY